eukprot:TRINITY_DN67414_c0_g1_i1.p1 TRINITY_DN67414_c0_g1~~TRINITY_DN67414_c0_g1_i1.p1  ORF type:complete len:659 (+),score=151.01 TRINITY_DN67414_c0_g1_i1:83-2059(+)
MGCGASQEAPQKPEPHHKSRSRHAPEGEHKSTVEAGPTPTTRTDPTKSAQKPVQQQAPTPGAASKGVTTPPAAGDARQLGALPPVFVEKKVRDTRTNRDKVYLVTAVARADGIEFGCKCKQAANEIFAADVSEPQLLQQLKSQVPGSDIPAFCQAIAAAFANGESLTLDVATVATVRFPVREGSFSIRLGQSRTNLVQRLFVAPLFHYWLERKAKGGPQEGEAVAFERTWNTLRIAANDNTRAKELKRKKERITGAGGGAGKCFDPNSPGPNFNALHIDCSNPHYPRFLPHNAAAQALIRKKHAKANAVDNFSVAPSDAELQKVLAAAPNNLHDQILKLLESIDDWDFDMFAFAEACEGSALFTTTYALLYRHGLCGFFHFDHDTLVRFLGALEAGYHNNHYHNAVHAADVLQCVHFILGPGGMIQAMSLTPEDIFGSLLASAMHDFGHPGFNNNFHGRTGAYLATLYNDRSILENHHCASVFELLKHDKYNILAPLFDEQKKDVRDTILEMVLGTDMGLHSKIFMQFRQRLRDLESSCNGTSREPWMKKREDARLALTIAIKMADISNCARAPKLYEQWAKRIADEFYIQGDVERDLGLSVSPFMDRTRHEGDFPKGQKSFMNYIVIPLFEAGAEFLPKLAFTVDNIQTNKDSWETK